MPDSPPDPLHEKLAEAESDLRRRLREACEAEARGVASDSTTEIRRLEDALLAAARAAERTLAARRQLHEASQGAALDAVVSAAQESDAAASSSLGGETMVRQFEDETGRRWRAWPVVPDAQRTQQSSLLRGLGEYQAGWICFEALDDSGRRRLPGQGRRWSDLPAEELPRLLAEAIRVPERKRH